jgi:pimeloyl-ACP methyl ester carboxylesterase
MNRKRVTPTVLVIGAMLLLTASSRSVIVAPAFQVKPCAPAIASARLTCGTVAVPENRVAAGGRTISINVVVVHPPKRASGAIPMFHLEGGPGVGATPAAPFYLGPGAAYAESRDVVLIDQRGTSGSAPLPCGQEPRSVWADEYDLATVDACRTALEGHADLTQYSTENAAADLDDVRAALGHDRIDIWALSYGTELAQAYMKRFPSHVRAAVLVGFVPLDLRQPLFHAINAQRVLDRLFYECARDAACNQKYPRLRNEWAGVLQRLDSGPVGVNAKGQTIQLRRGPFGELVRNMLGTTNGQRDLPALIHAAAAGDFTGFVATESGAGAPVAEGLYLSVVCSEAQPRIPSDVTPFTAGTFLGSYRVDQERAACAHWPRHAVAPSFYQPPTDNGIPTLVLSGSMDHVATPDWAWEYCRTRKACTFVSIPEMGHGPFDLDRWTEGGCFDRIATGFLANPAHTDSSCVATMRPPAFR